MHLFFVENTHLNSKQRPINIFYIHEAIFDTGCNYQYYMLIDRPSKNARSWIAYVFICCSRKPFNKYVNLRIVNFFTIIFFSNISIGRQLNVAPLWILCFCNLDPPAHGDAVLITQRRYISNILGANSIEMGIITPNGPLRESFC